MKNFDFINYALSFCEYRLFHSQHFTGYTYNVNKLKFAFFISIYQN